MSHNLINFNKYYDPKDVEKYELFIGPDGEYYKVKTNYESDENCTHYKWAEEYLKTICRGDILEKPIIKNKCKTPLEVLINLYGFVRYTHSYGCPKVFMDIPNRDYFGYTMSKEQINSIYNLLDYNNEKLDEETIKKIHREDDGYEVKVDQVFRRISR